MSVDGTPPGSGTLATGQSGQTEPLEKASGSTGSREVSPVKEVETFLKDKTEANLPSAKSISSRKAEAVPIGSVVPRVSSFPIRRDPGNNYFDAPGLVKVDLQRLNPEDPDAVKQFTDNITYAETRVPRPQHGQKKDSMTAQDYAFRAMERGKYDPGDLPLLAKLSRVVDLKKSDFHLRTLMDVMCMAATTRLAGLPNLRIADVSRMVKSGVKAESSLGSALQCRSSWLGAASAQEVNKLARKPETLNEIIGYRSDLKSSMKKILEHDLAAYEKTHPNNKHLKSARQLIEKLLSDKDRNSNDFEVSRTYRKVQHELESFLKRR